MLKLSTSLYKQPVISLRTGRPVAVTQEPIINPHNLKILGWWCRIAGNNAQYVLLSEDAREVAIDGITVNDENDLSTADDLVRHHEILNIHFELLGKHVKTKRQRLGKVSDYSFDDQGMIIKNLYVARPITKVLASDDTLIIDRTQIIEVTDKHILVRDSDVKVTEEDMAIAPEAVPT